MTELLGKNLTRESSLAITGKILLTVISVLTVIILARTLGPSDLGIYFISLALAFLSTMFPKGFSTAIRKRANESNEDLHEYFTLGLFVAILYSIFFSVFLYFIGPQIRLIFSYLTYWNIMAIGAIVLSTSVFHVTTDVYAAQVNDGVTVLLSGFKNTLALIIQIILIYIGLGVAPLLFAFAGATLVSAIAISIYGDLNPKVPTLHDIKHTIKFAKWSIPTSFITHLYGKVDIFIIGAMGTTVALGLYEASYRMLIPGLLIAAASSRALSASKKGDANYSTGEIEATLEESAGLTGLIAIPLFFIALVMPTALLEIPLGQSFTQDFTVWPYIVGLSLMFVFTAYREPFNVAFRALKRPKLIIGTQTGLLILNIPLSIYLVTLFGGVGAVIGTTIIELFAVLIYQFLAMKYFQGWVVPRMALDQIFAGFVMFIIAKAFVFIYPVVNTTLFVIVFMGAFAIYFSLLGLISSDFRDYVREGVGQFR